MKGIKSRIRARHGQIVAKSKRVEKRIKRALTRVGVPQATVDRLATRAKRAARMAVRGQVKKGKSAIRARAMRL